MNDNICDPSMKHEAYQRAMLMLTHEAKAFKHGVVLTVELLRAAFASMC